MFKKHSQGYKKYLRSDRWQRKSRWVRGLTRPFWVSEKARGRCVLFPWLPNEQTHHLTYYFVYPIGWNWWGFEMPVWHLVPLSESAHELVGSKFLWRQPVRAIVNLYLRISFLLLWTVCKPMYAMPTWAVLFGVGKYLWREEQLHLGLVQKGLSKIIYLFW